ncbi:MAG: MarR family transcriptional regulator [Methylobacteriaceae bacterium]|nr:MarR family transcriptional regulator [Methylobacteriaceae bacterium]
MPKTISEDDALRIWFRFLRLGSRIRCEIGNRLKALGISIPQCDVLTTLTEAEGLSQQDLATRLYVTKGNISGLIDRLVEAHLVERRKGGADRRSHAIFLTSEGRRIAEEGIAIQRVFVAETIGRLPADKGTEFEATLIAMRDLVRAGTNAPQAATRRRSTRAGKPSMLSNT